MENRIDCSFDIEDNAENYRIYMLINGELHPQYSIFNKEEVIENLKDWDNLPPYHQVAASEYVSRAYRYSLDMSNRVYRELAINRLMHTTQPLNYVSVELFSKVKDVNTRVNEAMDKWLSLHGINNNNK